MDKRTFLKTGLLGAGSLVALSISGKSTFNKNAFLGDEIKEFNLPELPYAYNALEPYIDEQTMIIHHSKHHAGYTGKFNALLKEEGVKIKMAREIFENSGKWSQDLINNAGGFLNHKLFWRMMSPDGGGQPKGDLLEAVNSNFGSFEKFKDAFSSAAKTHFGSGWAWLVSCNGKLKISTTANQDNPFSDTAEVRGYPLLCIDVWEHAYYLKYQNRRAEFVDAFWNIVNWDFVEIRLQKSSTYKI